MTERPDEIERINAGYTELHEDAVAREADLRLELATMTRDRDEARANVAGLARRLRELEGRVSDTGRLRRLETALEGAVSRWRTKAVDSPMAHTRLIWQTAADTVAGLLLELAKSDPEGHDDRTAV